MGTVTSVGTTGTVNGLTLTGTVTSSGNLTLGGTLAINNGDWSGTDLSVANGGTGASTLADNSVLTGTGTSPITAETYLTFENTGNVSTLSSLSNQDTGDLFKIATTTHGATTITTIDDDAAAADLTLNIDGAWDVNATGAATLDATSMDMNVGSGTLELTTTGALDINSAAATIDTTTLAINAAGVASDISIVTGHHAGLAFHLDADAHADSEVQIDAGILDCNSAGVTTIHALSTLTCLGATGATFGDDTEQLIYDGSGNVDFDAVALDVDTSGAINIAAAGLASDIYIGTGHGAGVAFHLDANVSDDSEVQIDAGILDVDVSGATTLDSGGAATFTSGALTKFVATGGVEIENVAASGAAALLIDNDDADQKALHIMAQNTTANIIDVATTTLTTGHALDINVTNAGGAGDFVNTIAKIDSLKQANTGNGSTNIVNGLRVNMVDEASANHSGSNVVQKGIIVDIDSVNATGTISKIGMQLNVAQDSNADAADVFGVLTKVMDGAKDIKMMSSADARNYCAIGTTTNGATQILTVDATAANADILVQADGDIRLTSQDAANARLHGAVGGSGIPMGIHHYQFKGYASYMDGNWAYPEDWADANSPFEISKDWGDTDIDTGSAAAGGGWDATGSSGASQWFRAGHYVVGRDCTTRNLYGWATYNHASTVEFSIIRVRPVDGSTSAIAPGSNMEVLGSNPTVSWTGNGTDGNHITDAVDASFAVNLNKGDVLFPMAKVPQTGKTLYFSVNLEVQWRDV